MPRSPDAAGRWLESNLFKFDGPGQFLGDEPGSLLADYGGDRDRLWQDRSAVRALICASWDYAQASGNIAIPAVINAIAQAGPYLADRWYLPATERDWDLLARDGLGVFGIETRRPLRDFDVVGTSISYTVLFQNFCAYLMASGVPLRRADREARPEDYPLMLAGGQAYCAPEFMSAVFDCIWLGEVEDEEGEHGGIGEVFEVIAAMKASGLWSSDRLACYKGLARRFSHLYFPAFTAFSYRYEDRGLPEPVKLVAGHWPVLEGMRYPHQRRIVKDLDKAPPLCRAPLLFQDPGMGAGDAEIARGCTCWCSFPLRADEPIITRDGVKEIGSLAGQYAEVWTVEGWRKGLAESHGVQPVQRITFVPATPSGWKKTETCRYGHSRDGQISGLRKTGRSASWEASEASGRCVECRRLWQRNAYYRRTGQLGRIVELQPVPGWERYVRVGWRVSSRTNIEQQVVATPTHGWELVDGTETHDLKVGDVIPAAAVTADEDSLDYRRGWIHGMVFGDGYKPGAGNRRRYHIVLFGEKDKKHLWRFEEARAWSLANQGLEVRSIRPSGVKGHEEDPSVWVAADAQLKEYPEGESPDYLAGFVTGWMAADSSKGSNGEEHTRRLYSQRVDARAWLDLHAAQAGWVLVGHSVSDAPTNYGPRSAPMNAFVLGRPEGRGWKVRSIEPEGAAPVFCLEVPETHRFTLAAGLTTQNCRLSWVTKPYREHSVGYAIRQMQAWRLAMGSVDISLVAPDPPVYSRKKELLAQILEKVLDEADASSMRLDDYLADPDFALLMSIAGADSMTLGLEGNCLHGSTRVQLPGVGLLSLSEMANEQRMPKVVKVGRDDADLEGVSYSGTRQAWRVTLSDGSQIMATPEHLVRVLDGAPSAERVYLTPEQRKRWGTTSNYLSKRMQADALGEVWREVRELRPGMVLRSYYGQMRWPSGESGHMGEDMAWLIGILSGDGRVTPNGIEVRCDDPGVEERAIRVLSRFGVQAGVRREEGRCSVVTAYRRDVAALLAGFGVLDTSTKRRVPYYIWRSPRSVVAAYLCGVLDADGCVPERSCNQGLTVVHGTHSEEFARDLGLLISAFGHPVSLQRNVGAGGYVMWHTTIHSAPDADWSWLEFSETSRQQALEAGLQRSGVRLGQVQWRGGQGGVKYVTVRKIEPDIETARVYDLHVPGIVAFTANNVVVHNSQRMRDLAGKGTTDDDVCEVVERAIRAGIKRIKLYMITNWPGETEHDVMRIVELGRRLAAIRESFGEAARNVRIQFSWTPLLIEAQTPLQWFEVTVPDYQLQRAMDRLRDYRIDMKIGAKANPNKLAFFQACQRASRDAGEALADVIEGIGKPTWGGFPKDMQARLDAALIGRGFRNGLADLFGERFEGDLFGWEHIDTGVDKGLMWQVYRDMVRFLTGTDAATYDNEARGEARGNEWVERCNDGCQGAACGACDSKDFHLRRDYIEAGKNDRDLAVEPVEPLDHTTVARMLRLRLRRPERYRFASAEFLRFHIRAAAYRACAATGFPEIAKRTVSLASDAASYRDRSAGVDYAEFGITAPVAAGPLLDEFTAHLMRELAPHLELEAVQVLPPAAKMPSRPVGYWELELDVPAAELEGHLARWQASDRVRFLLKSDSFYAGPQADWINAKEHVADFWVARNGTRIVVRMLLTGKLGPYQAVQALLGKNSWLPLARWPAIRLGFYRPRAQVGVLACCGCGGPIPEGLMGEESDPDYCPRCRDAAEEIFIAGLERSGVLQGDESFAQVGRSLWISTTARIRMPRTAVRPLPGPARGSPC